jgi:hypothetical protein
MRQKITAVVISVVLTLNIYLFAGCSGSNNSAQSEYNSQVVIEEKRIDVYQSILDQSDFSSPCPIERLSVSALYYVDGFPVQTSTGHNVMGDFLGVAVNPIMDFSVVDPSKDSWAYNDYYINVAILVVLDGNEEDSWSLCAKVKKVHGSTNVPIVDIEDISSYIGAKKPTSVSICLYGLDDYKDNLIWGAPFNAIDTEESDSISVLIDYGLFENCNVTTYG